MLKKFLQSACFGGKDYSIGIHEVSEETMKLPRFQTYIKVGLIVDVDGPEAAPQISFVDQQKAMLDQQQKLVSGKLKDSAPVEEKSEEEVPVLPSGEAEAESKDEEPSEGDADSEQKEEPSRKVKSKHRR